MFDEKMKDSIWNRNPAKFTKECKRLRALTLRIIEGKESVIEGARKMQTYRFWMKEGQNETWDIFAIVDSKSAALPVGAVRQHWLPSALVEEDRKIKAVEDGFRDAVVAAARLINEEYRKHVEPPADTAAAVGQARAP